MPALKTRKADLIKKYKITFEISLITSLLITILAFKYFPNIEQSKLDINAVQELFKLEDINPQTNQKILPPPPPKPNIITSVPSDLILDDIEIESSELDIDRNIAPPPIKKEEKSRLEEEPVYFVAVEEMPSPVGGIQAILNNLKYPEIAKRAGISGTVYLLAYLDTEGRVVKTEIIKGIGGGCNEAAAEAVRKAKFNPGKQRGKAVKVKIMIPIKFQIE